MPDLVLYQMDYCPYCIKITNYLRSQNITIIEKDTGKDPQAREELIAKTGRTQVPCLFIDGEPLLESDAILEWFKKNK